MTLQSIFDEQVQACMRDATFGDVARERTLRRDIWGAAEAEGEREALLAHLGHADPLGGRTARLLERFLSIAKSYDLDPSALNEGWPDEP